MDLTFKQFQAMNQHRQNVLFGKVDKILPADYAVLLQVDVDSVRSMLEKRGMRTEARLQGVANKLADALVNLDLLCARLGFDLEEVLVRRFNQVSNDRVGAIAEDDRIIIERHDYHLQCHANR